MEKNPHQASKPGPEKTPELTPVTILSLPPGPTSAPQDPPELTTVKILLSREEQAELAIIWGLAKVMDEALTVPGTKIKVGLDPIIGLIPVIGDLGSAAISAYILRAAARLRVPTIVQMHILLHILVDTMLGMMPIVGDYLDVLYKANMKSAALVQKAVENRQTGGRSSWLLFIGTFLLFVAIVTGGLVGTVLLVKWAWNLTG